MNKGYTYNFLGFSAFESKDLRLLRVAVQGIIDAVYLLIETISNFDPENNFI